MFILLIFHNLSLKLLSSKDSKLLYQLEFEDEQIIFVKTTGATVSMVPTKEEVEVRELCNIY